MSALLLLPLLLSLFGLVGSAVLREKPGLQHGISLSVMGLHLVSVVVLVFLVVGTEVPLSLEVGSWIAPFGIAFYGETLGVSILAIISLLGVLLLIHGDRDRDHALTHGLMMGASGALLTGDLFNLYVWFEVMMISAFGLVALRGRTLSLEAVWRYLTFSILASLLFLTAIGLVYGQTSALNFLHLSSTRATADGIMLLFVVGLGMKAAAFPMHFWMPVSYPSVSAPTVALLSVILTKVAVFSLYRVFGYVISPSPASETLFLAIGVATMTVGVFGAYAQWELKRLLTFHIMSQIGYMFLGLAHFSRETVAASLFFLVHNLLSKTLLFLVAGVIERRAGTTDLRQLGSLSTKAPGLFVLFLIGALSLAGVPPLIGFGAKWFLFREALRAEETLFLVVGVLVSLMTLFSMLKIWIEAFWKSGESFEWTRDSSRAPMRVSVVIAVLIVAFGFAAEPIFSLFLEGIR